MRLSLNWLKDYVDIDMPPADLANLLTMSGLEVEAMESIGQSLEEVVAAKILSLKRHPGADKLFVCQMDTGNGEVQVICSAPNLRTDTLVPMALPGVKLPGGMVVQENRIRGELSCGMLLAEDEMGLTDDHTGIMILPPDLKPGSQVASAMSLEDWAFDISITPNRPDCTSVIGIAREIAALTGQGLKRPEIKLVEEGKPIEDLSSVTIDDPEGCPRYAAGMIMGVEMKPSPFWMRYRLHTSGVRGIYNVVDVTNYVMLEMGQPLHAFDYDRLQENRIVVRRARDGEVFTTLDGQSHTLDREVLMICDGKRSVALAGIMGGLNSEIFAGSKNVLVESAFFDPITIRRASKRLGLSSEASYRFERGIDIEGPSTALKRALMLISSLAGGKIAEGLIDQYPRPHHFPEIDLRVDKTNAFLGTSLSRKAMAGYMSALEMEVRDVDDNVLRVIPPAFRVDLTREVDLMEEVARLEGYDKIPVTTPAIRPPEERDLPELLLRERAGEAMVGFGFTEIIAYSFISPDFPDLLGAEAKSPLRSTVKLLKPLSIDQSVMRTSLAPGLLISVKNNIMHGETDLKLFEWGKVFLHNDALELPHEKLSLTAVMTGLNTPETWYSEGKYVGFYDIKGAVESLLDSLWVKDFSFERGDIPAHYDPEASARISCSESTLGHVGRISSEVMERYETKVEDAYLFELDIETLLEKTPEGRQYSSLVRFPAVFRDISIIVERPVESVRIRKIIQSEGGDLIESVVLFDLYEGEKIDPSEKALTFRVCYRSKEGTLDGNEINRLHEKIINRIRKEAGGRLREG